MNYWTRYMESQPITRVKSSRSFETQTSREGIVSARLRISIRLLPAAFVRNARKRRCLPCIEPIVSCRPAAKQWHVCSPSCRCDGLRMRDIKTWHCVSPARGVVMRQLLVRLLINSGFCYSCSATTTKACGMRYLLLWRCQWTCCADVNTAAWPVRWNSHLFCLPIRLMAAITYNYSCSKCAIQQQCGSTTFISVFESRYASATMAHTDLFWKQRQSITVT